MYNKLSQIALDATGLLILKPELVSIKFVVFSCLRLLQINISKVMSWPQNKLKTTCRFLLIFCLHVYAQTNSLILNAGLL